MARVYQVTGVNGKQCVGGMDLSRINSHSFNDVAGGHRYKTGKWSDKCSLDEVVVFTRRSGGSSRFDLLVAHLKMHGTKGGAACRFAGTSARKILIGNDIYTEFRGKIHKDRARQEDLPK